MTDQNQSGPWNDYAAPTALPPSVSPPDTKPWEDYGPTITSQPSSTPQSFMGTVGQAASDALTIPAKAMTDLATNPVTMAHALPVVAGAAGAISGIPGGATLGNVGGNLVADAALKVMDQPTPSVTSQVAQGAGAAVSDLIGPLMSKAPTLFSAGIKPTTILKMTPSGVNPAQFAETLEDELGEAGAIGKNAKETFDAMYPLKEMAGQNVDSSLQAISQAAGPQAVTVPADTALKPILDGWAERAGAATTARKAMARPFEQIYSSLSQQAANQGGTLTMDNLRSAMDEIGPMVHAGKPETQEAMSELYGTLANARDGMAQTVAQQAGNPSLAQNLLTANAQYSRYMRLLPDVGRSAATEAVKEGVSAFQKYGGPKIAQMAAGWTGYEGLKSAAEKLLSLGE
jgi:hypothetical protein